MNAAVAVWVRPATADDLDWVKAMADRHKRDLGFVRRGSLAAGIARGELLVRQEAGFCHYRTRGDGWHVVYEIVSEQSGTGRELLTAVPLPVRLKCPADAAANGFYARMGGMLVATETGKQRALNVWEFRAWPAASS